MSNEKKENMKMEEITTNNSTENDTQTIEELQKKLDDKQKEVDEIKNQLLRLSADYANFKKRVERERSDLIARSISAEALLPVLDNFERALSSATEKSGTFFDGIVMIEEQIRKMLESHGIKKINPIGEDFDHKLHEAIMIEENDKLDSGKVVDVFQSGYTINDKLLRPAQVKVSK